MHPVPHRFNRRDHPNSQKGAGNRGLQAADVTEGDVKVPRYAQLLPAIPPQHCNHSAAAL